MSAKPVCDFAEFGGMRDCGQPAPFTTTLRRKWDGTEHTSPRCSRHCLGCNESWEVVGVERAGVAHTASDFEVAPDECWGVL